MAVSNDRRPGLADKGHGYYSNKSRQQTSPERCVRLGAGRLILIWS